ncbi:MAG: hypothetical protein P1S60_12985 [Anaerolineae bacterium]|nr:hypothetical protein [Anaerolineae bacterium]
MERANKINTYNESPLHAAIKTYIAQPGDVFETGVEGYIIDILRDELLIEVQTRQLGQLRTKLNKLLQNHRVLLIHPIALELWIVRPPHPDKGEKGDIRRKSPKRGRPLDIFAEMVSLPTLIHNPNFSLRVLYTREEELRRWEGSRAWRRKGWAIDHRRLIDVVDSQTYTSAFDFAALLPANLPAEFTTRDLADAVGCRIRLAQQAAYVLKKMGVLNQIGKKGRAHLYQVDKMYLKPEV